MVLLNVNISEQFEAESIVLQARLIEGTATSKKWLQGVSPTFDIYYALNFYFS